MKGCVEIYWHKIKSQNTYLDFSEDNYENTTLGKRSTNEENMYKNDKNDMDFSSEDVYENPGLSAAKVKTNMDDLHYADLMHDNPTSKAGKPVIHGLENRTEYAVIAYGIKGEPLPESDDEQERAQKK
ncbi:hypothetical protein ACJMK2_027491 [Sinanodonta woodiana]|uniref:Uncharacterized protein n=1 Tax=Sinanodonta woodiana TaxID=1069815 RepID=A0ABD3XMR8_SINWO